MVRKDHNHNVLTNLWHREVEPRKNHETPKRQTKQSNQLSLPHQDGCKTRMDIKLRTTKHRKNTDFQNGSYNKQQVNINTTTILVRISWKITRLPSQHSMLGHHLQALLSHEMIVFWLSITNGKKPKLSKVLYTIMLK